MSRTLSALSALYSRGLRCRHLAYDRGWFASTAVPACVVSVGNIAWGGTGKTPIVQKLAKELVSKYKVAVLSRGYRGGAEYFDPPLLVSHGSGPLVEAALAGDEAFMHALALPNVEVWSSKYRVEAARLAIARGAEVLILDDGMQHRKLKRDMEIITLDGGDHLLKQKLLPSGRLRDLPERLRCADVIIVHNAQTNFEERSQEIRKFSDAPLIATQMSPKAESIEAIANRRVAMFCAIGRPQRFESTLRSLNTEIVDRLCVRDHSAFPKKKLTRFAENAKKKGAEMLVCTRKDFVKLPLNLGLFPVVLDAEVSIIDGHHAWEALVKQIAVKIQQQRE